VVVILLGVFTLEGTKNREKIVSFEGVRLSKKGLFYSILPKTIGRGTRMNVVLIIIDTLRQDHVGCYGNRWIKTPYLDSLAKESVLFTKAYPESLPTLPVRRALHTGCRIFPFIGHKSYKGDIPGAPGWGPISEERNTIAEILHSHGYRTGFITDTYHQFKPSMNFHRGFDEWTWIRGQENDPYRSGPVTSEEEIKSHLPENLRKEAKRPGGKFTDFIGKYLTNVADRNCEEDYFSARVFREGARWLERNQDADKFFLVVDSFDPHEPWDPPKPYRKLYDPDDDTIDLLSSLYGPADQINPDVLKRLRSNYAGEVTLVDRWLGYFLEKMKNLGLMGNTLITIISDHGHCIGEHNIVGKQGHPMSREIADLVLMIRHPKGKGAGTICNSLVYNFDLPPTILARLGIKPDKSMEGKDIWPLALGKEKEIYDHVTCGWGPMVMVHDRRWWYNAYIWGEAPLLFDLEIDPKLENNIAKEHPDICERMEKLAIADAGGEIPDFLRKTADGPGCTPLLAE